MSWIRLSDNYIDHPKFVVISNGSFRLWHEGLAYCRRHQTDGLIPFGMLKSFRYFTKGREKELATVHPPNSKALWDLVPAVGYKVHDYLDWNPSREAEDAQRMLNNHRSAFQRDKGMKQTLRDRDQDKCRYCAREVNWSDRKGALGATYDHVNPRGQADLDNLVIACRGCNSRKRNRTPEQAGMVLLPEPTDRRSEQKSRSDLDRTTSKSSVRLDMDKEERDLPNKKEGEARSKWPVFKGQRLVVFDWMLENLTRMLGPHTDDFNLHEWFFELEERANLHGLVVPKRDGGAWLEAQTLAEAKRRGLPIASATTVTAEDRDARARAEAAEILAYVKQKEALIDGR